jgi:hypothetical protein
LGIKWIIGGHNLHNTKFFKDASKDYIEKINHLFKEGCVLRNNNNEDDNNDDNHGSYCHYYNNINISGNNQDRSTSHQHQTPYQIILPLDD